MVKMKMFHLYHAQQQCLFTLAFDAKPTVQDLHYSRVNPQITACLLRIKNMAAVM